MGAIRIVNKFRNLLNRIKFTDYTLPSGEVLSAILDKYEDGSDFSTDYWCIREYELRSKYMNLKPRGKGWYRIEGEALVCRAMAALLDGTQSQFKECLNDLECFAGLKE